MRHKTITADNALMRWHLFHLTAKGDPRLDVTNMNKATLSEVMRYLGSKTSKAKAEAARTNGRKGGRPKKVKP